MEEYLRIKRYLEYTLHELPTGVLYDHNGANEVKCKELMDETYRFEKLSNDFGIDNDVLLKTLRWHYERYPHYLIRHKHFGSYYNYIIKYNGPLSLKSR